MKIQREVWSIPGVYRGSSNWCLSPEPTNPTTYGAAFTRGLIRKSQSNPFSLLGKVRYRIGGDFEVDKREYTYSGTIGNGVRAHFSMTSNPLNCNPKHYYGPIFAYRGTVTDSHFTFPARSSASTLDALGTTAIARVIPTNPLAGLATTLGELRREGLPSAPGAQSLEARALTAKNAGKEYLNYEFGWKPLVNDVKRLANSVIKANALIEQYRRKSGKLLKRKYEWDPEVLFNEVDSLGNQPLNGNINVGQFMSKRSMPLLRHRYHYRRRWFEGAFVYHLPPQGSLAEYEALANKLLGTRLTPKVLWDLAPWSWAADWFSNAGDVINNISAFAADGLVMPWGYVMEETSYTITYTAPGVEFYSAKGVHTFSQTLKATAKTRRTATPFGFGLSESSLTGRQKAILLALGLARS